MLVGLAGLAAVAVSDTRGLLPLLSAGAAWGWRGSSPGSGLRVLLSQPCGLHGAPSSLCKVAPATRLTAQPGEEAEEAGAWGPFLQKSLLLMSREPEVGHMAAASCKGGRNRV